MSTKKQTRWLPALLAALLGGWLLWQSAIAAPVAISPPTILYDAAQGSDETPDQQSFTYFPVGPASNVYENGATTLDTTAGVATQAGYMGKAAAVPTLDAATGFRLAFTVQLVSETHAGSDRNSDGIDDRAGFSVILLDQHAQGIELGFWEDRVWAQEGGAAEPPRFTQAESAAMDTTAGLITYTLEISGTGYTLSTPGTTLLSGDVRDYTAEGWPYTTPNFIFLGDNTTSAQAEARLAYVAVTTETAVSPTPSPSPSPSPTAPTYYNYLPVVERP